jgi:hypothetical protein
VADVVLLVDRAVLHRRQGEEMTDDELDELKAEARDAAISLETLMLDPPRSDSEAQWEGLKARAQHIAELCMLVIEELQERRFDSDRADEQPLHKCNHRNSQPSKIVPAMRCRDCGAIWRPRSERQL